MDNLQIDWNGIFNGAAGGLVVALISPFIVSYVEGLRDKEHRTQKIIDSITSLLYKDNFLGKENATDNLNHLKKSYEQLHALGRSQLAEDISLLIQTSYVLMNGEADFDEKDEQYTDKFERLVKKITSTKL